MAVGRHRAALVVGILAIGRAQVVLPAGSAISVNSPASGNYVSPSGGCFVTATVAGADPVFWRCYQICFVSLVY
jgi:hypothetical protein